MLFVLSEGPQRLLILLPDLPRSGVEVELLDRPVHLLSTGSGWEQPVFPVRTIILIQLRKDVENKEPFKGWTEAPTVRGNHL